MTIEPTAAEEVFAALADPTRRRVLELLAGRGTATATELAEDLPVSRQAVVKHLAVLERSALVAGRRDGRERRYEVRPEALTATAQWMNQVAARWAARLSAIKQLAEQLDGD